MPEIYEPKRRTHASVPLPADGDRDHAASVNAALVRALDGARFSRDLAEKNWRAAKIPDATLYSVAEGRGQPVSGLVTRAPVLLAFGGATWRSFDGHVWTQVDATGAFDGAYSELLGLWMACGVNAIRTSPTGQTWTARTVPLTAILRAAAVGSRGDFLACGVATTTGAAAIVHSMDGLTFADVSPGVDGALVSAVEAKGRWVAVGARGDGTALVVSAEIEEGEALAFEEGAIGGNVLGQVDAVTFDGTRFIARARAGHILRSIDGVAWDVTEPGPLFAEAQSGGIAADPVTGVIVAVAHGQGGLAVSYDGGESFEEAGWIVNEAGALAQVAQLRHARGRFCGVALDGTVCTSLVR